MDKGNSARNRNTQPKLKIFRRFLPKLIEYSPFLRFQNVSKELQAFVYREKSKKK